MKEKFNSIPEALQKQIIIRVGASGLSLLLVVVVIAMYRDVYLSLAFVLFFLFFGASGVFMFWNAAKGRYIAIEGECTEVERTTLRKRPKVIYFTAEPHNVKLHVRQRLRNIAVGDRRVVYASENTPVYQNEGCQILSGYLALTVKKGNE